MSNYIRDAFKSLDLLEDTSFDLDTKDDFQELDTFINDDGDIDPEVNVFDLEANEEEELKDSYVGDAILECPVCRAYIFKPMEEVIVDNETELCCAGEECPVCGSEDGFKVIGKVAPFEEEEKSEVEVETEPDDDVEVEVEDKEEIKEALRKRVATKINEKQLKRKQLASKYYLNENIKKTPKKSLKESTGKRLKSKKLEEEISIKGLENAKDVSDEFSNYAAYKANFKPLVIVKLGREYYAYPTWAKDENDYRQHGTKDYINGWLYGAVQAKMKMLESKKLKEDFDIVDYYEHNKEVPDVAYEMASEISDRFSNQKEVTWDEFNEAFENAFPGVVDWTEDAFNELETDVRGVLGQYGWETIFEGENEGGLRVVESRKSRRGKRRNKLTEAPTYDLNPQFDNRKSFYSKARVDTGDKGDKNKLYSYNTLVAEIKDGKPVVYGTYSQTTLRHIKDWLKQNGFKAESGKQIMADYGVKQESLKEETKSKLPSEVDVPDNFDFEKGDEEEFFKKRFGRVPVDWDVKSVKQGTKFVNIKWGVDESLKESVEDTLTWEDLRNNEFVYSLSDLGDKCKFIKFFEGSNDIYEDDVPEGENPDDYSLVYYEIYDGDKQEVDGGEMVAPLSKSFVTKDLIKDLLELSGYTIADDSKFTATKMDSDFLDESLKSSGKKLKEGLSNSEISKFIKDAKEGLLATEDEGGCYRYVLDDDLCLYVGWESGYDEDNGHDGWDIAAKIGKRNDFDWADYEYNDMPFDPKTGEVWDTSTSADPSDADWFIKQYKEIRKALDKGKIVLESKKSTTEKVTVKWDEVFNERQQSRLADLKGKKLDRETAENISKAIDKHLSGKGYELKDFLPQIDFDKEVFICNVEKVDDDSLQESIESATIETEDQVINVSSEDKEENMLDDFDPDFSNFDEAEGSGEEMIAPLDDADIEEIESNTEGEETEAETTDETEEEEETLPEDEEDFEFDDIQEESFHRVVENYMKSTYSNIKSFTVGSIKSNKAGLKLEGKINFNSGKTTDTTFIFEKIANKDSIAKDKARYIGLNETFTDKKNAYVLRVSRNNNTLYAESLRYSYPAKTSKLNESVKLVKGFVR